MISVLALIITMLTRTSLLPTLQQPKMATPIQEIELVNVLQTAHIEVFGQAASKARIAVAWGQIAFENGRGRLLYNHNLGNIGPSRGQPYYRQGPARFRSFANFDIAARVYWELLRDRCSVAMSSFDMMNATYTAMLLRRCGYHRADIDRYGRGLNSLMWAGYRVLDLRRTKP